MRTAGYSSLDWINIRKEKDELMKDFAELKKSGVSSERIEAIDLAEQHRVQISKWFYDCTIEIHRNLGAMFVTDLRFTRYTDTFGTGLAKYFSEAIEANSKYRLKLSENGK